MVLANAQNKRRETLQTEVRKFLDSKITKLQRINHGWHIGLTAAGITCTLLTTVLGVVDGEQFKGLIKIGTGLLGAAAVATQSTANQFRLRGKAGEYKLIEAKSIVLAHKLQNIDDETALQELEEEFYSLIQEAAEIEVRNTEK